MSIRWRSCAVSDVFGRWLGRRAAGNARWNCTASRPLTLEGTDERPTVVVGIETSCDDTGVGIVAGEVIGDRMRGTILANVVSSQFELVQQYGGIMPIMAARAHRENLPLVIERAMSDAGIGWDDVDLIAVTQGPGLGPCLRAGLDCAVELSSRHSIPIFPVNHLEGHALITRLFEDTYCPFPYLTLIASGGHTSLISVNDQRSYKQLGQTLDDAVGEAFDKVARLLELDLSEGHGGKQLETLSRSAEQPIQFPVPMSRNISDVNFSFSGLKSAVVRYAKDVCLEDSNIRENIAAGFQVSAVQHLVNRTSRALIQSGCSISHPQLRRILSNGFARRYKKDIQRFEDKKQHVVENLPHETIVVSGGVASNDYLQQEMRRLGSLFQIPVHFPPPKLCTDNGVMIAWAALEVLSSSNHEAIKPSRVPKQLTPMPSWKISEIVQKV
mmetsp:Transcript_6224/g.9828  ORF Transcript_6224/g.9828 Transcript_6224/m.9828 type:complete len:442 (+) Transcript_6224:144-1469(+)